MSGYEEITTTMEDLQPGDLVMGIDGEWHEINLLPIHLPEKMYRIKFENGTVECSGTHDWTFYDHNSSPIVGCTDEIFKDQLLDYHYGKEDGPRILEIEEIEPELSRCLSTNSPGHLFEILTDQEEPVFTHNCQMRLVCGRLGSVASLMALGNTLATTINGAHPGAGAIASNGIIDMVQYYYAEHEWLLDWYAKRGLDNFGYGPENKEAEKEILENLEGEEELEMDSEVVEIEFAGIHAEIDKSKDQKFEEI